jgi:hypothetical protein
LVNHMQRFERPVLAAIIGDESARFLDQKHPRRTPDALRRARRGAAQRNLQPGPPTRRLRQISP